MNPNEQRLKELQGKMEAIKAEMSQIKANMQSEKAAATIDEAVNIDRGRGLQGNRDAEGNMITEKQVAEPVSEKPSVQEIVDGLKLIGLPDIKGQRLSVASTKAKGILTDAAQTLDGGRTTLVSSPEFQEAFGDAYDVIADPLKVNISLDQSSDIDEAADKKIKETFHDMDSDYRKDKQSKKMRAGGISREQGRAKPMLDTSNDTMPGWTQDEAGNWSVDTESDYWSTKEGYKEAIQMYGFKPSFVSEPKKKGMVSSYKAPKRISL